MANVITLLDAVTEDTTGEAVEVLSGRPVAYTAFSVGPGGSGQVIFEGSFDGTHWASLPNFSTLLPSTFVTDAAFRGPIKYIRANYFAESHTSAVTAQALQSDEDN